LRFDASTGMAVKQGVAAPCCSYAFYASCIHHVITSRLLLCSRCRTGHRAQNCQQRPGTSTMNESNDHWEQVDLMVLGGSYSAAAPSVMPAAHQGHCLQWQCSGLPHLLDGCCCPCLQGATLHANSKWQANNHADQCGVSIHSRAVQGLGHGSARRRNTEQYQGS